MQDHEVQDDLIHVLVIVQVPKLQVLADVGQQPYPIPGDLGVLLVLSNVVDELLRVMQEAGAVVLGDVAEDEADALHKTADPSMKVEDPEENLHVLGYCLVQPGCWRGKDADGGQEVLGAVLVQLASVELLEEEGGEAAVMACLLPFLVPPACCLQHETGIL